MRVNVPRSGGGLSAFLQAILHGAGVQQPDGPPTDRNGYLGQATLARVQSSLTQLKQGLTERERLAHLKKTAVAERAEGLALLERTIRDLWSGLRRRTRREDLSTNLLTLYGLTVAGNNPANLKPWLWTDYARKIIKAEQLATAEGFEPLVNPGVEEVAQLLARITGSLEREAQAAQALLAQQKKVNELVQEAYYLVLHVLAELRLALRGRDAVYVRNVIRNYGGSFRGETSHIETAETSRHEAHQAAEPEPIQLETPADHAVDERRPEAPASDPPIAAGPAGQTMPPPTPIGTAGKKKRKRGKRRQGILLKRKRSKKRGRQRAA